MKEPVYGGPEMQAYTSQRELEFAERQKNATDIPAEETHAQIDDELIDTLMQDPSNLSTLPELNMSTTPKVVLTSEEAIAFMASFPFCRK